MNTKSRQPNSSILESDGIRRVFANGLTARDIAEPLSSWDAVTSAANVAEKLRQQDFDVAGIREDGFVVGYASSEELLDGACGDAVRYFTPQDLVTETTPLNQVVLRMTDVPRLFVTAFGMAAGIITHDDLQKPPLRMWLFGLMSLIETRWTRLINEHFPDDGWKELLSAGRLKKAEALLAERQRRKQTPRLLDCLQFSEKGQIVARTEELRNGTIFDSRRKMQDAVRKLEGLRNNLAHSQDIIAWDWEIIVGLTRQVTDLLDFSTDEFATDGVRNSI